MNNLDEMYRQIHEQNPDVTFSIQKSDDTILFFNNEGLPRIEIRIKGISMNQFGQPAIVVDYFDYRNKLKE